MGKSLFNGAITCVVAFMALSVATTSCVEEEYELSEDRLDLNVTVFQEGISIPLGTTEKIVLDDLFSQLDKETQELFDKMGEGYMFSMSDHLDVTNDITGALKDIGGLEGVTMSKSFEYPLNSIDLSNLKIEGRNIEPETIDLADKLEALDVDEINEKLPKIKEQENVTVPVDIPYIRPNLFVIDMSHLEGNLSRTQDIVSLGTGFPTLPDVVLQHELANMELNYDDLRSQLKNNFYMTLPELETNYSFEDFPFELDLTFTLPEQIQSVEAIELHPDASMKLSFKIIDPLFTSGSVKPSLKLDLSELVVIDRISRSESDDAHVELDEEGAINDEFEISKENEWTSVHEYHIDALALKSDEWTLNADNKLELNKHIIVTISGDLPEPELYTTLRYLAENKDDVMKVAMDIEFCNFEIDDVRMAINPIKPEIKPFEMAIEVDPIDLGTDLVKKVEYIEFDDAYPLTLNVKANLPQIVCDMDIVLENLKVSFPDGVVIDETETVGIYDKALNTLTYENISLTEGMVDNVMLERIYLPDLVNNTLAYNGDVKVTAIAAAEGILSSKAILAAQAAEASNDVSVNIDINYSPMLQDFSVVIDDYTYDVEFDPVEVNEPLSKEIGEIICDKPLLVSLEKVDGNNPKAYIKLSYPDHEAIRILPKEGEGLKIDFPDMVRFEKPIPAEYNFNPEGNTMIFTGEDEIPTEISLTIENIEVLAEKVEGSEDYVVKDYMDVTGGVRLVGTTIHLDDINELKKMGAVVSFEGNIPDIVPASFGLNEYEKTIEDKFTVEKIETELPEMVESIEIQDLLLKDVYLDLFVDASSVKDIVGKVDMSINVQVELPSMLVVESESEGVTIKDNVLTIEETLDQSGKLTIDGVHVVGLDLSGIKVEEGKISVEIGDIPVKGTVKLQNLEIDMEKLKDKTLDVKIDGTLASRVEPVEGEDAEEPKIIIDRITGKVDMAIDPIEETIDLSSLTETLNAEDMSVTVDISTFYLTLDLNTNIDIPLVGQLEVTPYFGDVAGTPETPGITLNPADRKNDCYNIFISNIDPNNPKDGYDGRYDMYKEYQCIPLDLISMISKMEDGKQVFADRLKLSVNAGVDPKGICVIEPNKEYVLAADYTVGVPLELGDKFAFEYRTKIDDLPEVASQVFAYGSVGLGGKVTNCLPLNLNLQVIPLDSDGKEIPLAEGVGLLKIASCDAKGNPVTTKLDFVLSGKGTDLSDMKSIGLVFTADAHGVGGAPLRPEGYLQVELNARIPDGVTLDLSEFLNSKDDEDNQ